MSYKNIAEIKRANHDAGFYFFSPAAMKFFRSIVYPDVYGGRYFITSEQFVTSDGEEFPRSFTIREALSDGQIETVNLPRFKSLEDAQARAEVLAARVDVVH